MTVAKFKVVLRKDKVSKCGDAPICLRITKDRKCTYKTLCHVNPQYWDDKAQCVKKRCPNAELLNTIIAKRRAEIEQETCMLAITENNVSISTIRNKITTRTSFDLFEYADKYIRRLLREDRYSSYKKCKSVIWKLRHYVGKEHLFINSITEDFLKKYESYLMNTLGNNRNTTTVNMKTLGKLVGDIYRNYNLDEQLNPFRKLKFHQEQTDRIYLDIEDIKKIQDFNVKLQSPLYDAREIFLFECFTGLRISDILTLRWKNITNEGITICMRKTDKTLTIPLHNYVKFILKKRRMMVEDNGGKITADKYVFNILKIDVDKESAQDVLNAISSATAIINKRLKYMALRLGIKKNLSTHVGRHSFATMLVTGDVNLSVIKELLGHSDIKVTQIYAKVVSKKKEEAINILNRL